MFSTYFSCIFRDFFVLLQVLFCAYLCIFLHNYTGFYASATPDLPIICTLFGCILGCYLHLFERLIRVFLIVSSVILRMLYISTIPKSTVYRTHQLLILGSLRRSIGMFCVSSFWVLRRFLLAYCPHL